MKQAWRLIGSPDAISWVVIFLVSVQQISGSLIAPFAEISGRVWEFLFLRVISLLLMVGVLVVGKLLLLRFAKTKPRPWITIIIFALTPVVGAVTINWLLIIRGFTNEWTLERRFVVAIPGIFTILVVSAILVSYARELARRNEELAGTAQELEVTRKEATSMIESRKLNLISEVRAQLENSLSEENGNSRNTSQSLKSLIDDVVRPLSYRLTSESGSVTPNKVVVTNATVSWSRVISHTLRGNPAHPIASTIWLGALLGMFLATGFGLRGLLGTLALCGISFVVLGITRALWPLLPTPMSSWQRAIIFTISMFIITTTSAPTMQAISGYNFTSFHAFTGWTILSIFMIWTVSLVFGVIDNLRGAFDDLTDVVERLNRETIQLNNELREIQTSISVVLHGPIQAAISASIHRLRGNADLAKRQKMVSDLRKRIDSVLNEVEQPITLAVDLNEELNDLVELWEEIITIEIQLDEETQSVVEQDRFASGVLLELIREACSNAVRHGEATNIWINVSFVSQENLLLLEASNDGHSLSLTTPGLGSQIFDERCLSWTLTQSGPHVRLEARIPLSQ